MFEDRVHLGSVVLDQETGRQVVPEGLIVLGGELGVGEEGVEVGGNEEGRGVEEGGLIEHGEVGGEVLGLVLEAGSKVGAEGTFLVVDQDGAAASRGLLIDGEQTVDACAFKFVLEGLTDLVVSNASEESAFAWSRIL
jgi:hypothetical protein